MPDFSNKKPEASPAPKVISRGNILLLCAAIAMFAALMAWFVFGTVRTSFTYTGVLTGRDNALMIHQSEDVVITDILVVTNQFVKEGDVLLRVYPLSGGEDISLEEMSAKAHDVLAPANGYVTEIEARQWERADITTTLVSIMPSAARSISYAIAYVPIDDVQNLDVGMDANIQLQGSEGVSRIVLGGTVAGVSDLPVSEYNMLRALGSERIVQYFYIPDVEQYEVMIALETDDNGALISNVEGLRKNSLICNEMCQITFYSEEIHPYQIIFND